MNIVCYLKLGRKGILLIFQVDTWRRRQQLLTTQFDLGPFWRLRGRCVIWEDAARYFDSGWSSRSRVRLASFENINGLHGNIEPEFSSAGSNRFNFGWDV